MRQLLINNLTKTYQVNGCPYHVLKGLNCVINADAITVILGKSGCGKTTLLRLICGLETPERGNITNSSQSKIGMMFQEARLMPWLTCKENITFGLGTNYDKEKISALLTTVGLTNFSQAYPAELSGGMQQRTALARTLACDSDLILMDEPFAALDYFTRQTMQKEVLRVKKTSHTGIIFVTHNIDEALILADRIMVLQDGTIKKDVTLPPRENRDTLATEYIGMKRQILAALQIN